MPVSLCHFIRPRDVGVDFSINICRVHSLSPQQPAGLLPLYESLYHFAVHYLTNIRYKGSMSDLILNS